MRPTAVINLVGLSESLLGPHAPTLEALRTAGRQRRLVPPLPAVTTTVQSTMLTGRSVRDHGIVANGWYDRDLADVQFWKQSNRLVVGDKVWDAARRRDPSFTSANMFWWYNMYSSADFSVTPRPIYCADGRKLPDCSSDPPQLRDELQSALGPFPLFRFWGPAASIESTRWIADASIRVHRQHHPTLMLVYLPHLDYPLQKVGPDHPSIPGEVAALDAVVADLKAYFDEAGVRTIWLSEYGIEPVDAAGFPNRVLRQAGMIRVREELGREVLDPGACRALAVADHQVAHVYVRDPADLDRSADVLREMPEVEAVLDTPARRGLGIDHPRAGDLVLVARPHAWFSYDYWLDDRRAPDYARTVDIHRKPGYDPRELHLDPAIRFTRLAIGSRLIRKKLGFRTLMDVIPLDTALVAGSHGRVEAPADRRPILITDDELGAAGRFDADELDAADVHDLVLESIFGEAAG